MGLAGLAAETLKVIEEGGYDGPAGRVDLRAAIDAAVAGTTLITPERAAALVAACSPGTHPTTIEVTSEGTAEAAHRLVAGGEPRVLALNFASARNVGGGFLGGAQAQEEELCRCSALYACLSTQRAYYEANRAQRSAIYTDHAILSPDVPFFRDVDRSFVARPWTLTVLTSPAPNTGAVLEHDPSAGPALAAAFERRIAQVLAIAADAGHEVLVLGAWGCGAFQGDPELVARLFAEALAGPFRGVFRRVVFGVLVRSKRDERNLEAFRRHLEVSA
ncbi:MAG: TIGR02452 family protein [Alphaproteobacteria bacterium]|nr:TIGR02452 family protein [Alphaproteobacteria bacterium]MCB9688145.1 TIGR02452 family protein [Alphaproteobacteria bacterium]